MNPAILHFVIIIFFQTAFFYTAAYFLNVTPKNRYLVYGLLLSVPVGLFLDLYTGEYLNIYSYHLGFTYPFLLFNWTLSWGIFIATIFLLKNFTAIQTFIPVIIIGATYEFANFFAPVWEWTFATSAWIQFTYVVLIAYPGIAMILIGLLAILRLEKFSLLQNKDGDKS